MLPVLFLKRKQSNMKASEFVNEAKVGTLEPTQQSVMNRANKFKDSDNGTNHSFYRVGLAAACSDGKNMSHETNPESWIGTNNLALPYTQQEHDMMKHAMKSIGIKDESTVHKKSSEPGDTHRISPVANLNKKIR